MKKKLIKTLTELKGMPPSQYFMEHFSTVYPAPPVDFKDEFLIDAWKNMPNVEQRFIHLLYRAYPIWCRIIIDKPQQNLNLDTPLQYLASENKPDFPAFLFILLTQFDDKKSVLEGIDLTMELLKRPFEDRAYESSCYFFLLASKIITSKNEYQYMNAMLKAMSCLGEFNGFIDTVISSIKSEKEKSLQNQRASKGGNSNSLTIASKAARNELIKILEGLVENKKNFSSVTELVNFLTPKIFSIMESSNFNALKNTQGLTTADLYDRVYNRVKDWGTRKGKDGHQEIISLFKELTKKP